MTNGRRQEPRRIRSEILTGRLLLIQKELWHTLGIKLHIELIALKKPEFGNHSLRQCNLPSTNLVRHSVLNLTRQNSPNIR